MNRRSFLEVVVSGGFVALGGLLAVPAVATVISPLLGRRRRQQWVGVGRLADLAPGEVREALVDAPPATWPQVREPKVVYVARRPPDRPGGEPVVVFSRSCTDLGCPVLWDPGSRWFLCPCHGGIFCEDGLPRRGPPSRPLYRYATRVRGGVVEIDLCSVPPMV